MAKNPKFEVKNYGDMIAQVKTLRLIEYFEKGSYQGDYLAVLSDEHKIYFVTGSYGSCSGCDWLEDYREQGKYMVKYLDALKYVEGETTIQYILPADSGKDLIATTLKVIRRMGDEW